MDIYVEMARKIIEQQEAIIGPLAVEQARKVPTISVNWSKHSVTLSGDESLAIDQLVNQYKRLFGRVSVEVCKDVTAQLLAQLPADKQPESLR